MSHPGPPRVRTAVPILAAISVLLLTLTLIVAGREAAFVLHASKASATFEGAIARNGGNHGGTFLYPQFRFTTSDGQSVEMTSKIGSTDQPYSEGQREDVLYDPADPKQGVLDHFWTLWGLSVASAIVTSVLLSITLLIWRSGTSSSKELDKY